MRTLFHTCRAVSGIAPALRGGVMWMVLLAAVLGTACGMRTSIQAEADAPVADGGGLQPCGLGPPCDPDDVGGRTCESLGLGSGVVSCNAVTCNLDLSRCGGGGALLDGGQTPVGSGSPGTPGLFGSAAGSTAPGLFGAGGQGGLFGTGADGGFFGAGNTDAGFFGAGTNFGGGNTDEDGGTDEPGTGFFGGNFFGGGAN
jgi:hypothetical protein